MILAAVACGGGDSGSGSAGGANSMALVVDGGPLGSKGVPVGYVNGAFVTGTVCVTVPAVIEIVALQVAPAPSPLWLIVTVK